MGGGITRLAAEDPQPHVAGVVMIAGAGGDLATRRARQPKLAAAWPAIDPAAHPGLPDSYPAVQAYATIISARPSPRAGCGPIPAPTRCAPRARRRPR